MFSTIHIITDRFTFSKFFSSSVEIFNQNIYFKKDTQEQIGTQFVKFEDSDF